MGAPEWVPHRQLMEVDFYSFPSCLRGALESHQARPGRSQTSTPAAQRSQCCALEQEAEPIHCLMRVDCSMIKIENVSRMVFSCRSVEVFRGVHIILRVLRYSRRCGKLEFVAPCCAHNPVHPWDYIPDRAITMFSVVGIVERS